MPGDPYNPQEGFLSCFLADVNRQDYKRIKMMGILGAVSSYKDYKKDFTGTAIPFIRKQKHFLI